MERKLRYAVICLYGATVIQILVAVSAFYQVLNYNRTIRTPDVFSPEYAYPALPMPFPATELAWAAIGLVAAVLISRELKAGEGWAWAGGVCLLIFCSFGFALPFVIAGLLFLLDREVRTEFLKKLEISI